VAPSALRPEGASEAFSTDGSHAPVMAVHASLLTVFIALALLRRPCRGSTCARRWFQQRAVWVSHGQLSALFGSFALLLQGEICILSRSVTCRFGDFVIPAVAFLAFPVFPKFRSETPLI
jgi:hypothetical protein